MARQTDYSDVVGEIFSAELCAEANLFGGFLEFVLKFDVAERVAVFVALGGEVVVIFDRGFFTVSRFFSAEVPPITKAIW